MRGGRLLLGEPLFQEGDVFPQVRIFGHTGMQPDAEISRQPEQRCNDQGRHSALDSAIDVPKLHDMRYEMRSVASSSQEFERWIRSSPPMLGSEQMPGEPLCLVAGCNQRNFGRWRTMAVARTLARDTRRPRPRLFALASGPESTISDKLRAAGSERCLEKPVSHEELDKVLGIRMTA